MVMMMMMMVLIFLNRNGGGIERVNQFLIGISRTHLNKINTVALLLWG